MAKETWNEVKQANIWLPEDVGQQLEGEVLKISEGQFGSQALIKTKEGEFMTPSHKWLQNRLASLKVGDFVRIEYTGKEASKVKGHQPALSYKVFVRG